MKKRIRKMVVGFLVIVAVAFAGLFLYVYRWNIVNPNKSSSVTIDHLERTFVYHVPKNLKKAPKLIIAYHGSKMKAFLMQIFTGHEFDQLADKDENTIVVYPQGYKNNWNDCRKEAPFPAKQLNVDDVRFTEEIISFFRKEYQVNPANIFAVGYSNGGQMVMKLARQKPEWFKGFAVISANLPTETNDDCTDANKQVSLLLMNGTSDPVNPYEGGEVMLDGQSFGPVMSTEQNLKHWLTVSNCDKTEKFTTRFPKNNKANNVTAIQKTFISPATSKQISFIKIINGGHTIPNRNFRIPIKQMGKMNQDIDGPKLVWDFFMMLQ